MSRTITLAAVILLTAQSVSASGAAIGLDAVWASNGSVTWVADDFNDDVLGPPWEVLRGTPGPESGTELEMHPDDVVFAPMLTDPQFGTIAAATISLTDFPVDSAAAMVLTGDEPGEFLALAVTPTAAALIDEEGLMVYTPLQPGATASMLMYLGAGSGLIAEVNDEEVFAGVYTLGAVTGIGVVMVPEPATAAIVGAGLMLMGACRRRTRLR